MARPFSVIVAFLVLTECQAFTAHDMQGQRMTVARSASHEGNNDSRRGFLADIASTSAAFILGTSGVLLPSAPALAISGGNKVDAKLRAYGLPPLGPVPNGFSPLLEFWGKGKNRFPILVSFMHPLTWVVTTPSIDSNGEDGTIQAGEYAKGDTATFYVYSEPGHVADITTQPKELYEKALIKCISQKGDNMYQNFKVLKLEPVKVDNQNYMVADFKYQLITGAGFEVDRRGVASMTSEGPAVEVLWTASTAVRFKKTEPDLRAIVASFRCYTDGLNFSEELVEFTSPF
jgi:hypothetical protein